uniref:Uncharacterized protein n=1 Tax=Stomoxys calcitrans TaxID=35570 RepID=A0A1I8PN25_STOCA
MSHHKNKSNGKLPDARRESAWDQLTKVRKTPTTGSRQNSMNRTMQRFQLMKKLAANHNHQELLRKQQLQEEQRHPNTPEQRESPRGPLTGTNPIGDNRNFDLPSPSPMLERNNQGWNKTSKILSNPKSKRHHSYNAKFPRSPHRSLPHPKRNDHLQLSCVKPEMDSQGYFKPSKSSKLIKEMLNARSLKNTKSSVEKETSLHQHGTKRIALPEQFETSSSKTLIGSNPHNTDPNENVEKSPTRISRKNRISPTLQKPISPKTYIGDISNNTGLEEGLEETEDEYKLAPLMFSSAHCDLNSSQHILQSFQVVLQQRGESSMAAEELKIVKQVIKHDERYHQVDKNNTSLLKDILKTQLQDILKQQKVVKQALRKLDSGVSIASCEVLDLEPLNNKANDTQNPEDEDTKILEVGEVSKNCSSLEREILILKALGEKLEFNLNRVSSQRNFYFKTPQDHQIMEKPPLQEISIPRDNKMPLIQMKKQSAILPFGHYALSEVHIQGVIVITAVAQEFRIAQKSLVELKQEAKCPFYIPLNTNTTIELKETSFEQLRENPDMLLKQIKPKSPKVNFNFLDHDPLFFHDILFNNKKNVQEALNVDAAEDAIEKVEERPLLNEKVETSNVNSSIALNLAENDKHIEISPESDHQMMVKSKKRSRITRRYVTPLPLDKPNISPKNNLCKTILIGGVQISCFLLLIIAFTLPDVKC